MKGKILYIEDDPNHQFTMQLLLGNQYQLVSAYNGKDGLEKARAIQPNLIIVDIMLHKSEINGYKIIKSIKSIPELKQTPVIAITGHTGEAERAKCYEEGCDGFFTKPINVDSFADKISMFMNNC